MGATQLNDSRGESRPLPPEAQAKLRTATALFREAENHKRQADFHRRRAKRARQRFDEFRSDLEAMGIEVAIDPSPPNNATQPLRRPSDDRSARTD